MVKDNFHWLVGDRFVCVFRKNVLIDEITENGNWSIKNFTAETADEFVSTINEGSLFDIGKTLYIHDGTIPEQKKSVPFIEKLNKKKVLIVIEGDGTSSSRIDKRTTVYKRYKKIVECFDPVIQPSGFPDRKNIPFAKIVIKEMLSVPVPPHVLDYVFELCGYDYGRTVNEIEKSFYWAGCPIESIKQIEPILYEGEATTTDKSVNAISSCDFETSLKETNNFFIENDEMKSFIPWASMLAENLTFILHCRTAIDLGCVSQEEVGQFISERLVKKDKKIDPFSAQKRYYVHKENVKKFTSKSIGTILGLIEDSIFDFIHKKLPPRYLANNIVLEAAKLHYQNV